MYRNWKEAVTLGAKFVNGTSKLKCFFFRLEIIGNLQCNRHDKEVSLDFLVLLHLFWIEKNIIRCHIKCVRTYTLHKALPLRWLHSGHLVTQNILNYYLQAPEQIFAPIPGHQCSEAEHHLQPWLLLGTGAWLLLGLGCFL